MPHTKTKPAPGNLPAPLSTFIGRGREIEEIRDLLSAHRLVTLTGAGGSGKTRLALRVASELQRNYENGVWLVELASLSDPALVTQAVASHLNVREQPGRRLMDTLADDLAERQLLLVLDNCEHLIKECAQFGETILQRCPNLRILATSREMWGIAGESVFVVPPLSLPEAQPWKSPANAQNALNAYAQSEAVQLFVSRGTAIMSDFVLNPENGPWVSEICRRLDGMPLAIELAAARVRALSVQQIAERLDDRFNLLTGGGRTAAPRQQTLAATLDWSYALLSDVERKVLQRLSVFAGGATLEAVEAVCAGEGVKSGEILNILSHLVEKSLVVVDKHEGGGSRYRLLETIRQYSLGKLTETGGEDETKDRHLNYFVQWAERAEPYLSGGEQILWVKRFEIEHDNLRAALEWSVKAPGKADEGLRLAAIVGSFWKLQAGYTEGRMRLAAALALEAAQPRTHARAKALFNAALLSFYQSDYPESRAFAEESLAIGRELGASGREAAADALEHLAEIASETGDYSTAAQYYAESLALSRASNYLKGVGENLKMIGWLAMRTGDYERAEPMLDEALVVCRQTGNSHQIISALDGVAELAIRRGRYPRAHDLLQESLEIGRQLGEKWQVAIALGSLGWIALRQQDFKEMKRLLEESLALRLEGGDKGGTAWCLEKLAEANSLQSRFQSAAIIFGAAAAVRAQASAMMDAVDRPDYERTISRIRTALGEDIFESAWAEGEGMPLEVLVDYALHEADPTNESAHVEKEKFGGLTAREREVAALIAQGRSNRDIAKAMTVGAKTVETYVTRILNKLGFDSRVQIATWAMEKGLNKKESQ
jgi:predicted ATPase/DNA-binding CsgD family transcriptional regulator